MAVCSAASLASFSEYLAKYNNPKEANKHREELVIIEDHFKQAFEKVNVSSYQQATILRSACMDRVKLLYNYMSSRNLQYMANP